MAIPWNPSNTQQEEINTLIHLLQEIINRSTWHRSTLANSNSSTTANISLANNTTLPNNALFNSRNNDFSSLYNSRMTHGGSRSLPDISSPNNSNSSMFDSNGIGKSQVAFPWCSPHTSPLKQQQHKKIPQISGKEIPGEQYSVRLPSVKHRRSPSKMASDLCVVSPPVPDLIASALSSDIAVGCPLPDVVPSSGNSTLTTCKQPRGRAVKTSKAFRLRIFDEDRESAANEAGGGGLDNNRIFSTTCGLTSKRLVYQEAGRRLREIARTIEAVEEDGGRPKRLAIGLDMLLLGRWLSSGHSQESSTSCRSLLLTAAGLCFLFWSAQQQDC